MILRQPYFGILHRYKVDLNIEDKIDTVLTKDHKKISLHIDKDHSEHCMPSKIIFAHAISW